MTQLPELIAHSCAVLSKCDEFKSHNTLQALFSVHDLQPYRDRLPEATSLSERVQLTVDFLWQQHLSDGRPIKVDGFVKTRKCPHDHRH